MVKNYHWIIVVLVSIQWKYSNCTTPLDNAKNEDDVVEKEKNETRDPAYFNPVVTATCRTGIMTVKVETMNAFSGVVHSRDYRKEECSGYGSGVNSSSPAVTLLKINMLSKEGDSDYCGIFYSTPDSEELSMAVAVRTHSTLELAGDKFYMITCGKAGFINSRNETSTVNLQLMRKGKAVERVVQGQKYSLQVELSKPDSKFGLRVHHCFSFSDTNDTVQLIDSRGCPDNNIISPFKYENGKADAQIKSMFKFHQTQRVHFQCSVVVCRDECDPPPDCGRFPFMFGVKKSNDSTRSDPQNRKSASRSLGLKTGVGGEMKNESRHGSMLASYSVLVMEPGTSLEALTDAIGGITKDDISEASIFGKGWILYLCIGLAILVVSMLLINLCLCSNISSSSNSSLSSKTTLINYDGYFRGTQVDDGQDRSCIRMCCCLRWRTRERTDGETMRGFSMFSQDKSSRDGRFKDGSYVGRRVARSRSRATTLDGGSVTPNLGAKYSLGGTGLKPIPPPLISIDTTTSASSSASSASCNNVENVPHHLLERQSVLSFSGAARHNNPHAHTQQHSARSNGRPYSTVYNNGISVPQFTDGGVTNNAIRPITTSGSSSRPPSRYSNRSRRSVSHHSLYPVPNQNTSSHWNTGGGGSMVTGPDYHISRPAHRSTSRHFNNNQSHPNTRATRSASRNTHHSNMYSATTANRLRESPSLTTTVVRRVNGEGGYSTSSSQSDDFYNGQMSHYPYITSPSSPQMMPNSPYNMRHNVRYNGNGGNTSRYVPPPLTNNGYVQ